MSSGYFLESGIESARFPAASGAGALKLQAVVEPIVVTGPELDPLGDHPITTPMRGARYGSVFKFLFKSANSTQEFLSAREGTTLMGCPSANLAAPRASGKVGFGLLARDLFDSAFDLDLTHEFLPKKQKSDMRILKQFF